MSRTSPPVPTFEVAEWQTRLAEGQGLSEADQRLKQDLEAGEEGRLLVDELRTGVRVTARSWVGVVRFERFEVRVVPKLAGDNLGLVEMIEFATGLSALRRSASTRTLQAEGAGLLDLIALLLAEATEVVLRGGLLADYVEREDDLPVVRGRLLADQQMLRRFGRVDRLVCRFDERRSAGGCPYAGACERLAQFAQATFIANDSQLGSMLDGEAREFRGIRLGRERDNIEPLRRP